MATKEILRNGSMFSIENLKKRSKAYERLSDHMYSKWFYMEDRENNRILHKKAIKMMKKASKLMGKVIELDEIQNQKTKKQKMMDFWILLINLNKQSYNEVSYKISDADKELIDLYDTLKTWKEKSFTDCSSELKWMIKISIEQAIGLILTSIKWNENSEGIFYTLACKKYTKFYERDFK